MRPALMLMLGFLLVTGTAHGFDHSHARWQRLLNGHVVILAGGKASQVDYAGMQADHRELQSYLGELSSVGMEAFRRWNREQRLAFLINAYNAFTVELILSGYPEIESIRDLGNLLRSPWKRRFFTLLGSRRHLDELEHGMIRAPGVYDDPRIHFAVNCASIGCPMLREEAYVAERLDEQLNDAMRRFLGDRSRNRFEPEKNILRLSKIFDWYADDFIGLDPGSSSMEGFLASQAAFLTDNPQENRRVKNGGFRIEFFDYDWRLNAATANGKAATGSIAQREIPR